MFDILDVASVLSKEEKSLSSAGLFVQCAHTLRNTVYDCITWLWTTRISYKDTLVWAGAKSIFNCLASLHGSNTTSRFISFVIQTIHLKVISYALIEVTYCLNWPTHVCASHRKPTYCTHPSEQNWSACIGLCCTCRSTSPCVSMLLPLPPPTRCLAQLANSRTRDG